MITIDESELRPEWRRKPNTLALYVHLRFLSQQRGGEFLTSLGELSELTGLSVQEVRTALSNTMSTRSATRSKQGKLLLITIAKSIRKTPEQHDQQHDVNTMDESGISTRAHICEHAGSNPSLSSLQEERLKERKKTPNPPKASKTSNELFPDAPHIVTIPEWIPLPEWNDWIEMRSKRAPATPKAQKIAIEMLSTLRASGNNPADVLKQSVLCGWKGLFAVKSMNANKFPQKARREDRSGNTNIYDTKMD